ncbi:hypothetical protein COX09_00925 [Candidatus Beckwithbacteria bacterium CG23_combo_of_CG06-09_8_20_14_all_47_9]|uniref:Toxin YoeB n=1 Tax=Candidatus Beckwithbacteria bacterium CG23_combo_of_CG06-09_8_20_14_all_47_9 TaxID=1974498 RepID=A0A2H0B4I4_9BACT|nr:MAG: hypothetical protein COX09_00925 [Candidatus Beckwithbacteria bacterium CG23_combo_of_CG06-09_8_20_14_all_47_9]
MVKILPVNKKIEAKIKKFALAKKWQKQLKLLRTNLCHPGLNLELMEPRNMGIYSFRIDKKFRALVFFRGSGTVEILNITVHYH